MDKYDSMSVPELRAEHKAKGLSGYSKLLKAELIESLEIYDENISAARASMVIDSGPLEAAKSEVTQWQEPEPSPAPVGVKGRSVGATMTGTSDPPEATKPERKRFAKYPSKQARNKAKTRRRAQRGRA